VHKTEHLLLLLLFFFDNNKRVSSVNL